MNKVWFVIGLVITASGIALFFGGGYYWKLTCPTVSLPIVVPPCPAYNPLPSFGLIFLGAIWCAAVYIWNPPTKLKQADKTTEDGTKPKVESMTWHGEDTEDDLDSETDFQEGEYEKPVP